MLEGSNLYVEYSSGNPVLKDFRISISFGEKVVLMGPNGSGKSTFIKTVLKMLPYRGALKVMGKEVRHMSQEEVVKNVAFFLQVDILEDMKVGTYLKLSGIPLEEEMNNDFMNIKPLLNRRLRSLSMGEVQRVRLSRVFWSGKPILLLDEPFAHLDPFYQIRLVEAIKGYWGAVMLTVHDVLLAIKFFDRHILMKDGRIISYRLTPEAFERAFDVSLYTFL